MAILINLLVSQNHFIQQNLATLATRLPLTFYFVSLSHTGANYTTQPSTNGHNQVNKVIYYGVQEK